MSFFNQRGVIEIAVERARCEHLRLVARMCQTKVAHAHTGKGMLPQHLRGGVPDKPAAFDGMQQRRRKFNHQQQGNPEQCANAEDHPQSLTPAWR